MEACWQSNPQLRPSFAEIVGTLSSILHRLPKEEESPRLAVATTPTAKHATVEDVTAHAVASGSSTAKCYDLQRLHTEMVSTANGPRRPPACAVPTYSCALSVALWR